MNSFDENRVLAILGPMAGITDKVFRRLCLESGADLALTEMVSAKALSFSNDKTKKMLEPCGTNELMWIQLFGHEVSSMEQEAANICEAMGDALFALDVNMGCPARKIVSKGDGGALMNDPDLAAKIVEGIKRNSDCLVTVKFRRGYNIGDETCVDFAKSMEAAGADAITIHGRFVRQLYSGNSDMDAIKKVKESVSIPVIGNGDIRSGKDALRMIDLTGCDHLMVSRASLGNPWVFTEIRSYLDGECKVIEISHEDRLDMAIRHASLLSKEESVPFVRMRKLAAWYMKGMPNSSKARARINQCTQLSDFLEVFQDMKEEVGRHAS